MGEHTCYENGPYSTLHNSYLSESSYKRRLGYTSRGCRNLCGVVKSANGNRKHNYYKARLGTPP